MSAGLTRGLIVRGVGDGAGVDFTLLWHIFSRRPSCPSLQQVKDVTKSFWTRLTGGRPGFWGLVSAAARYHAAMISRGRGEAGGGVGRV